MNYSSFHMNGKPILIVPYMWIGDFVRCHTVVRLLLQRQPGCAIDVLTTPTVAPLLDYMPGVRKAIVADLPRKRLAWKAHAGLAKRLRAEGYGQALVMPRTWKSALAPYLAGIPRRTGFVGEARFALINDLRLGEQRLPRMVDRCAALALARDESVPESWPLPQLMVPASDVERWCERRCLAHIRDLTGADLREAVLALAAACAAVSNDSGLLHVAAALGRPAIGIFGPTSPWHWAPLNPISALIETVDVLACRPCHKPVCRVGHHRCMRDIKPEQLALATRRALAQSPSPLTDPHYSKEPLTPPSPR